MERELQGVLLDLDETRYSREEALWEWIDIETSAAPDARELDRHRVAELDQRGRGDKQGLLEYLDSVLDWRQTQEERQRRFRSGHQRSRSTGSRSQGIAHQDWSAVQARPDRS
jgi:hypothetical protein